jgi:hypothetical protein
MKNATTIVFATALALSALASTVANAAYLENTTQITATKIPAHVALKKARALNSMAYAPADFGGSYVRDFGIGSQR